MAAGNLDDANFEDTLEAEDFVFVDFWGQNCAPCRQMAPVVDELATELSGRVLVAKLNVHENPLAAHDAGIRGVPTFVLYRDGKPVAHHLGRATKVQLRELIEKHLVDG